MHLSRVCRHISTRTHDSGNYYRNGIGVALDVSALLCSRLCARPQVRYCCINTIDWCSVIYYNIIPSDGSACSALLLFEINTLATTVALNVGVFSRSVSARHRAHFTHRQQSHGATRQPPRGNAIGFATWVRLLLPGNCCGRHFMCTLQLQRRPLRRVGRV